ncbi:MAG: MFS transporter [Acidimicrobiales bacterium]|nr:MFS transporter [Acidimicrobiales bacterium]
MTLDHRSPLTNRAPWRQSPWLILGAAVVLQGVTAPGQTLGVSVFIDPIAADLDLSRSAVSAAYLVGTLTGALSMPAAGRLIDRKGVRFATLLFGGGFAVMLVAMSGVVGFVTLAIGFAGTRALGQGALTLTATTTVAVWFDKARGTANGIKTAAGGALMALVPIVSTSLIAAFGWRTSWVVLGAGVLVVVVVVGVLVVADPPSRYAATVPAPTGDEATTAHRAHQPDWEMAAVVRHPAFLMMTAATALSALISTGLMFHHVDLLAQRGLTPTEAAATFLPLTVSSAGSALLIGPLADRVPAKLLTGACLVLLAGAPVMVQTVHPGITAAAYGFVLGSSGASIRTLEATALPRWFGIVRIGQIRGVVMAAGVGCSAVGPLIVSLGADWFGSYSAVLNVLAAVALGLAVVALFVRPPR